MYFISLCSCIFWGYNHAKTIIFQQLSGISQPHSHPQSPLRQRAARGDGAPGAYIKQFHTFSEPDRDPRERVITIAYYALVRMQDVNGGDDAARAQWWAMGDVPSLAFDHDMILRLALQELRRQIHFEPIGFELLPEKFTMSALQQLYEAILDVKFDRRNFYKKMLHLGLLTQLDETDNEPGKRNAFLYSFNRSSYEEMKRKGFRLEF